MFYRIVYHNSKQIAINLNHVRTITKIGPILKFHLGCNSISRNVMWIGSDEQCEEVVFETEERAQQEYDKIIQYQLK